VSGPEARASALFAMAAMFADEIWLDLNFPPRSPKWRRNQILPPNVTISVRRQQHSTHYTMPRLTKAQKEARGGKPSGGKPQGKGFKVGPSHAPRNAYLGKGELLAMRS
jgi:hypothetical protein